MSVYTKRLVGPVLNIPAGFAWATVGTVPANKVWVVTSIWIANGGAAAGRAWLAVNGHAAGTRVWIRDVASLGCVTESVRLELAAGEFIDYRDSINTIAGTVLTITGYEFAA